MKNKESLKTFSEILDLNLLKKSELIKIQGGTDSVGGIPIMTTILPDGAED